MTTKTSSNPQKQPFITKSGRMLFRVVFEKSCRFEQIVEASSYEEVVEAVDNLSDSEISDWDFDDDSWARAVSKTPLSKDAMHNGDEDELRDNGELQGVVNGELLHIDDARKKWETMDRPNSPFIPDTLSLRLPGVE